MLKKVIFCLYTSRSKNLEIQEVESKSVDSLILFVVSQHRQWWSDIFYFFIVSREINQDQTWCL